MRLFILLIIVVPAIEIMLFIYFGNLLGFWTTLFLIIATGILGVYLAKLQGLQTIQTFRRQIQQGYPPGDTLIDGICIISGGILLLIPGFVTDTFGLFLLLPPTRQTVKPLVKRWIKQRLDKRTITIIR